MDESPLTRRDPVDQKTRNEQDGDGEKRCGSEDISPTVFLYFFSLCFFEFFVVLEAILIAAIAKANQIKPNLQEPC